MSKQGIQERFNEFIISACAPYASYDSRDRLKTALYQFLNKNFGIENFSTNAQTIVLGKENAQAFVDTINLAKERYQNDVVKKISEQREKTDIPKWEVPIVISYNSK